MKIPMFAIQFIALLNYMQIRVMKAIDHLKTRIKREVQDFLEQGFIERLVFQCVSTDLHHQKSR